MDKPETHSTIATRHNTKTKKTKNKTEKNKTKETTYNIKQSG